MHSPRGSTSSDTLNPNTTQKKRTNYLGWDEYFMATAFLAAKRSKDPCSQVGTCIVNNEKQIVGVGYNGMPRGCHDDEYPWCKDKPSAYDNKYMYVCHAAVNAIVNKISADIKNCKLYTSLFPCNECAKLIIQSGIKEVIYVSDKYAHTTEILAAKRMFKSAGVDCEQYKKNVWIDIDFAEIDSKSPDATSPENDIDIDI